MSDLLLSDPVALTALLHLHATEAGYDAGKRTDGGCGEEEGEDLHLERRFTLSDLERWTHDALAKMSFDSLGKKISNEKKQEAKGRALYNQHSLLLSPKIWSISTEAVDAKPLMPSGP